MGLFDLLFWGAISYAGLWAIRAFDRWYLPWSWRRSYYLSQKRKAKLDEEWAKKRRSLGYS